MRTKGKPSHYSSSKDFRDEKILALLWSSGFVCAVCGVQQNTLYRELGITLDVAHWITRTDPERAREIRGVSSVHDAANIFLACRVCNKRQNELDFDIWATADIKFINSRRIFYGAPEITAQELISHVNSVQQTFAADEWTLRPLMLDILSTNDGKKHRSKLHIESLYFDNAALYTRSDIFRYG